MIIDYKFHCCFLAARSLFQFICWFLGPGITIQTQGTRVGTKTLTY